MDASASPAGFRETSTSGHVERFWQVSGVTVLCSPVFRTDPVAVAGDCGSCSAGKGLAVCSGGISYSVGLGAEASGGAAGRLELSLPSVEYRNVPALYDPANLHLVGKSGVGVSHTPPTRSGNSYTFLVSTGDASWNYTVAQGTANLPTSAPPLRITAQQVSGGIASDPEVVEFRFDKQSGNCDLARLDANGTTVLRLERRRPAANGSEEYTVLDGSGRMLSKENVTRDSTTDQVSSRTVGKDTESYLYDANGQLSSSTSASGATTTYTRDPVTGRVTSVASPGPGGLARTVDITTSPDGLTEETTETLGGITVGHRWTVREYVGGDGGVDSPCDVRETEIEALEPGATINTASNRRTVSLSRRMSRMQWRGDEQRSVLHPDGTVTLYEYANYVGTEPFLTPLQTTVRSGIGTIEADGLSGAVTDGTCTVTVKNANGWMQSSTTTDILTGTVLSQETYSNFDGTGRPQRVDHLDGTYETMTYGCCGLKAQTDAEGITTGYEYDELKNPAKTKRLGIETVTVYDAQGRAVSTVRYGTDGNPITLSQSTAYNVAGQVVSTTDAAGAKTFYVENSGGLVRNTTYADGSTSTTTSGQDGSLLSQSVNGIETTRYEYGVEVGGSQWTKEIRVGNDGTVTEWVKSYTNLAGQNFKTEYADGSVEFSFYNGKGQLVKSVAADGEIMLYVYNAKGEQEFSCLDVNKNDSVDFAGPDRITRQATEYAMRGVKPVRRMQSWVYDQDGMGDGRLVSVTETTLDGRESWSRSLPAANGTGGLESHSVTVLTRGAVAPDGSGTPATRTVTSTAPDGSYSVSQYQNGRLVSAESFASDSTRLSSAEYAYDAHGRSLSVTTPQAVATYVYGVADRVVAQTVTPQAGQPSPQPAPQTTAYEYDKMGRVITVTAPDGTKTYNRYTSNGQLWKTWGGQGNYPVEYAYDTQGRMTALKTWRDVGRDATAAVTTWSYDPQRGFPVAKTYPDGKGPAYTYTPGGKLATRTWARAANNSPLTTTYAYAPGTGDLLSADYSNTPGPVADKAYNYDRLGRPTAVTAYPQAPAANSPLATVPAFASLRDTLYAPSTTTYSYNTNGQLAAEAHTSGPLAGFTVERAYDTLMRPAGFTASAPGNANLPIGASYTYDTASRLASVTSGSTAFTYAYVPDRGALVASVTARQAGTTVLTTTKTHDAFGRLLSTGSASPVSNFQFLASYTYNSANQRVKNTRENGSYWDYQYDDKGQLIAGVKKNAAGKPIPGLAFGYAYDDIGNRKTSSISSDGTTPGTANLPIGQSSPAVQVSRYQSNALNQYTARTVPGRFQLSGVANPSAVISVVSPAASSHPEDVTTAARDGDYWHAAVPLNNTGAAAYQDAKIVAVLKNQGPDGKDIVGEAAAGKLFLPKTPELRTHDDDGNLLNDGRWAFTWDAENRLVAAETLPVVAALPSMVKKRLEFVYDASGRRIAKTVFAWQNGAWTLEKATAFLYDGWNLVGEFALSQSNGTVTQSLVRSYTWGLDLSGSFQGAGGVGGLLGSFSTANGTPAVTFPVYDGNGNVLAMVDATGLAVASYEYDPFGKTLLKSGSSADANLFRFSTKYFDVELSLYYYGYRHYAPEMGAWLSRDPIAENGGINLYAFVKNSTIGCFDILGLANLPNHIGVGLAAMSQASIPLNNTEQEYFSRGLILPDMLLFEDLFLSRGNVPVAAILDLKLTVSGAMKQASDSVGQMKKSVQQKYPWMDFDDLRDWAPLVVQEAADKASVAGNRVKYWWDDSSLMGPILRNTPFVRKTETVRSHFSDMAYYHGMGDSGDNASTVKNNIVSTVRGLLMAFNEEKSKGDNCGKAYVYLGMAIHILTDTWTPGHTVRKNGSIQLFQDYSSQSLHFHEAADNLAFYSPEDYASAVSQSAKMIKLGMNGGSINVAAFFQMQPGAGVGVIRGTEKAKFWDTLIHGTPSER